MRVDALGFLLLDIGQVHADRLAVQLGRFVVPANQHVDVRGHVHEVSGVRRKARKAARGRKGARRIGGFLDRVDKEMVRPDVGWALPEHPGQGLDGLQRSRLRLPVARPPVPGSHVEKRLGENHGGVQVVRVFHREPAHRVRERDIQRMEIRFGIVRIAPRQRIDVRALACRRRRSALARLLHFGECFPFAVGIDREVHVRPERISDSPVPHGARRIEPYRLPERPNRFVVIEGVAEL